MLSLSPTEVWMFLCRLINLIVLKKLRHLSSPPPSLPFYYNEWRLSYHLQLIQLLNEVLEQWLKLMAETFNEKTDDTTYNEVADNAPPRTVAVPRVLRCFSAVYYNMQNYQRAQLATLVNHRLSSLFLAFLPWPKLSLWGSCCCIIVIHSVHSFVVTPLLLSSLIWRWDL